MKAGSYQANLLNTCIYKCTNLKSYTIHTAGNLHNHQVTWQHYHRHSKQQMHKPCGYTEMDLCLWFSLHVHGRLCKLSHHWNSILLEYLHLRKKDRNVFTNMMIFVFFTEKLTTHIMLYYFFAMFSYLYVKCILILSLDIRWSAYCSKTSLFNNISSPPWRLDCF